jgi:K+-transporting ATPase ATPase C chain
MVLLGGVYQGIVWAIGRVAFPAQAEGSLIRDAEGRVVGSRLIAQAFSRPEYFHPRPSAVDYNGASTGGSNYGPSNPDHLKAVGERLSQFVDANHVPTAEVPSEMVTTSGAGLDPHIPPAGADIQVARVAAARRLSPRRIRDLVQIHTERPLLGFLGEPRVNVLELNLALDAALGRPPEITRTHESASR